jgi:hypothetical protein
VEYRWYQGANLGALTSVNQDPGQVTTGQWWQWIAFTKDGRLATSYDDRQDGDGHA